MIPMVSPAEPRRGGGLAATFPRNLCTFTLITSTMTEDKKIPGRWRDLRDTAATLDILLTASSAKLSMRSSSLCGSLISVCRVDITL